jgi:hypothetical protein
MDEVLPVVVAEEHARLAVLCFHAWMVLQETSSLRARCWDTRGQYGTLHCGHARAVCTLHCAGAAGRYAGKEERRERDINIHITGRNMRRPQVPLQAEPRGWWPAR